MNFDYAIGDPCSYNEDYTAAIWPHFANNVMTYAKHSYMCFPANWLFSLDHRNASILFNNHLKSAKYIQHGQEYFYRSNNILQFTVVEQLRSFEDNEIKIILEDGSTKYIKDNLLFLKDCEEEFYDKFITKFSTYLQPIWATGFEKNEESVQYLYETADLLRHPIKVLTTNKVGRKKLGKIQWYYIEKDKLDTSEDILNCKKIAFNKYTLDRKALIIDKNELCYSGYVIFIPKENNEYHINLLYSLLNTKCARYCLKYRTKSRLVAGFELIPDYTNFISLLDGNLISDKWIYQTFDFSKELINEIESTITIK